MKKLHFVPKILSAVCAAAMLFSLTACGQKSAGADYSGQTVTGKVTKTTGETVTLQLGELTLPEKTDGENTQTPPENTGGENTQTPPEKTDGENTQTPPENTDGENAQTPPEKPDGENTQTPPDMQAPGDMFTAGDETLTADISSAAVTENGETVKADDIAEGDILKISFDEKGIAESVEIVSPGNMPGGGMGMPGSSGDQIAETTAANTLTEDASLQNESYSSRGDDENALIIDGASVTLDGVTVEKSGGKSSNTENGDFYGVNAALLAKNGAIVTIKNSKITSTAQNGNGVFSYGSGTTVNISDCEISTSADNSGGIQTTGGGTTNAENLTVNTLGNSSAAIRSDRGGGTVNVNGGSYTSAGYNSPAVYSTAEISVKNALLTAENSEALVIEGKNSITLENCTVTGNMSSTKGTSSDENVHNIMIYQSMSGDADIGKGVFSMTGGSLISNSGDTFYITNTECDITLSGVSVKNNDTSALLMRVCGNSASHGWGTAGKNGADATFTADSQTLNGDITVDSISTLSMVLKNGSVFNGTVNIVENAQNGEAVENNAVITVESGCTWNLTGNCTVTSLTNNGTVNFNGYTITLADGTVLSE